jgi:hypothetical protein
MQDKKFIYAVIDINLENPHLAALGIVGIDGINAAALETVCYKDLAAVISTIDATRFELDASINDTSAEDQLKADLLKYQQVNAFLLAQSGKGGMLPLKFGFTASDKQEVGAVLERAYIQLRTHLDQLKGTVELVVQASWDMLKVIQDIARDHPEFISTDPVETGKRLFEATEARSKNIVNAIHQQLSPLARNFSEGPHKAEGMILNRSYLVEMTQESLFDGAMNDLGNQYEADLSFRYIGPLPAYSFVNIELNQGNFSLLDQARKTLQLPEAVTWAQIKLAYRQLLLACHPDRNPDNPRAAQLSKDIVAAYEMVSAYCQSFQDFAAQGDHGKYSFAKDEIEKAFIVNTKGAVLAQGN